MNVGNVSLVQQNTIKQNEHMNAPFSTSKQNKTKWMLKVFLYFSKI